MAGRFTRTAADRGLAQIRHVRPVRQAAAHGLAARVYSQVERDFGMLAPPVALHSPAPESMAAAWLILRETLVATGRVARATKEAVAAAVSLGNACPYCVDVHTATLHGVVDGRDALAIVEDRVETVTDPEVRRIAAWARASGRRDAAHPVAGSPARPGQLPELVGVATTFHYFNRMVHVFLPDSPIPPVVPALARGGLWRLLGRFMWGAARRTHEPGASLDLLPVAVLPDALPDDLSWTAGSPHIAGAFAGAVAAADDAGARSVPEPVRQLVLTRLAAWQGQPTGLGRAWVEDAVSALRAADRPAGRLALLTAMASYQVDQQVVEEFRRDQPDDRTLVELAAWASLTAARRVGGWLAAEAAQHKARSDAHSESQSDRAKEPPAA